MSSGGRYAGQTASERTAERRDRLMEAYLDLVHREGWRAAGVRAVCAEARLNPRYFYESFAGIDELMIAAFDQVVDSALARTTSALAGLTHLGVEQLRPVLAAAVQALLEDPRRAKLALTEALGSEELMRRRVEIIQQWADLTALALATLDPPARPAHTIHAHVAVGGLIETLAAHVEGRLDANIEDIIDGLAESFTRISSPRPAR